MEPITVRFTPTASDYMKAMWHLRRRRTLLMLLITIGGALTLAGFARQGTSISIDEMATSPDLLYSMVSQLLPSIALIIIGLIAISFDPLMAFFRALRDERLRLMTTFQFSEDSIELAFSYGELRVDWSYFSRAWATKNYIFLMLALNKSAGHFIPHRALESSEQEAAMRSLLKRKLNFR